MISRIGLILLCLLALTGCQQQFHYELVKPIEVKGIHPDSLKWKYASGRPVRIPVRDQSDQLLWLNVNESTTLVLKTVEPMEYHLQLNTVTVEENEEGLLGSNTAWRGHDRRAGTERSVLIREVAHSRIRSTIPASERILPKQ